MKTKIKIGISQCLLGEKVRWDGGHKHDRYITGTLGQFVEFVPVCPEVEAGFGVPRESMRLIGDPAAPRLMTFKTKVDHTERMLTWAKKRVETLKGADLCGFIFKCNSPSCSMMRIKVYNKKGMPAKKGVGLFARIFKEQFPLIPAEDDDRLHAPKIRENFIVRIFTLKRWREVLRNKKSIGRLVDFHSRNKLLILSHNQKHYREMGKIVAAGKALPVSVLYQQYEDMLMQALALKTTLKKNMHVLQHLMGCFKKQLSRDEKKELLELFDQYRKGHVPLVVPITIINHYVRKYGQPHLDRQTYLNPHPLELKLRAPA